MSESTQAVPPASAELSLMQDLLKRQQEVSAEELLSERDHDIANLAQHQGWRELCSYIQRRIENYRELRDIDVTGLDFNTIGLKYVIASLVANELEMVIKMVDDTYEDVKEAVEKEDAEAT